MKPAFGVIKTVLGSRQFLLRRLEKVRGKRTLVCLVYNLKRLHRLWAGQKLVLVGWGEASYPLQSVDGNGLLTAVANVYSVASGNVNGHYNDASGVATVQVLGPYAGSTVPDWWVIEYLGPAPNAAAPDNEATGTGQNNLFTYVAGVGPRWPDRAYTPMDRTNLLSGRWQVLSTTNVSDNATERTVTDLNAVESNKFYRIPISLP